MIAYNSDMVGKVRSLLKKHVALVMVSMLCTAGVLVPMPHKASAATLSQRSLTIGDATPSATTTYAFKFSFPSTGSVGSILFEYCTSPLPALACTTPPGLNASQAVLASQSSETGFSILKRQAGTVILSRAPSSPSTNSNPSVYTFSGIVNPNGAPGTFYVRITTFAASDATGPLTDFGAVVNATTQGIGINTEVPPILKFCVGLTVGTDCTTADGSLIDLGDLKTSRASSGSSQMVAATNAQFGLVIAAYGTTMTSGNNVIPALATPTTSASGNSQFGLNLRKNTDPAVGQEPLGAGISNPTAAYSAPNKYMFKSGDVVATSPNATDTRKFTASYIVNISPNQAPGVYTATLTYICTASF
jgi:hypothetical protein